MKNEFTEQRFDYSQGRTDAPELIVMVGVSGSGKSVLAKQWVNRGRGDVVRFNRDSLRAMLYVDVPWSNHNEELTRRYAREGVILALRMGRTVIVDDTNCSVRVRNELEEIARDCRAKFRLTVMSTPLDVCIERDSKREGKEKVGEGVIRKQYKDLNGTTVSPKAYGLTVVNRAALDREAFCTREISFRLPEAKLVLCDIDGTLADHEGDEVCFKCGIDTVEIGRPKSTRKCSQCDGITGRSPFDEDKVLLDKPYPVVVAWVRALYPHYNVIIVSGRHNTCSEDTCAWLEAQGVPFDYILMREGTPPDNRSDVIVKQELLDSILRTVLKDRIAFVLDDRPRVINGCWKAAGLKVYPVRGQVDDF